MTFASRTQIAVEKTQSDIRTLLRKSGSTAFGLQEFGDQAEIVFDMRDRRVRFKINLAGLSAQSAQSRWRALLLVIKAKMESVDSGIETFDEVFLSHIVTSEGDTIMDAVLGIGMGRVALLEAPRKK